MHKPISKLFYSIVCLICSIVLSSCTSSSNFPKLTTIYSASSHLNPDINNQATPLVVTLYQLKSDAVFKDADFYALYNKPKETLGEDLIQREQIEIQPTQTLTTTQDMSLDARYIAIVAAFRDLSNAEWRNIIPISRPKKMKIAIKLGSHSVTYDT